MTGLRALAGGREQPLASRPQARLCPASGPRGPQPPKHRLSLIKGGIRAPPTRTNPFTSRLRIMESDRNILFVNFSSPVQKQEKAANTTQAAEKPSTPLVAEERPGQKTEGGPQASKQAVVDIREAMSGVTSKCKGLLNFRKEGKFDQVWMIKWLDWYKYVVAMTRRTWDAALKAANKLFSALVRSEYSKTAWAT